MQPVVRATQTEIEEAVEALRAGDLVVFPTETVYGLGANASNPAAVRKIFEVKGPSARSSGDRALGRSALPASLGVVRAAGCRSNWPRQFWPGPLTLILPKADNVNDIVTGGQDSIGIRVPSHPMAQQLLNAFGGGIAAPSANRYGRLSPTKPEHVRDELGDAVKVILDGGDSPIGLESTIVSCLDNEARLLRPGFITRSQLEQVVGNLAVGGVAPRAPGDRALHYAPSTPLEIVRVGRFGGARRRDRGARGKSGGAGDAAAAADPAPHDVDQCRQEARYLCAQSLQSPAHPGPRGLRENIRARACPQDERWAAILDRLQRASGMGDDSSNSAWVERVSSCQPWPASPLELDPDAGSVFARGDPTLGGPLRLAVVHHRCRTGAARNIGASPRRCPASICTMRSSRCRTRRSSTRCRPRAPSSIWRPTAKWSWCAAWSRARALHSHAPDQARQRYPHRAQLRGGSIRGRQSRRTAQVREVPQSLFAADSRLLPQPRGEVRFVAQVRLRSGGGSRAVAPGGGAAHQDRAACRFTSARKHAGPGHVSSRPSTMPRAAANRAHRAGHAPHMLDIGGGFPVDYLQRCMPIEEFCAPIRAALGELPPGRARDRGAGPLHRGARGRCGGLGHGPRAARRALVVLPRRWSVRQLQRPGVTTMRPIRWRRWWHPARPIPSVLAGPTCDSIDVIHEHLELPKLEVGDLIVGREMGAYTWASASEFNFFPRATVLALDRRTLAHREVRR